MVADQERDEGTLRQPVFIARGLTKAYGSGATQVLALHDVDLDIHAGEFVVLLGPSGSGKSTLLNILGGLDAPTSGKAQWRDHVLTGATEAELTTYRREHVGFVFQFYNLIPSLTVRENVMLVAEIAENPMAAEEALALVGLSHRMDNFPSQLSGGEQQRVATTTVVITHNSAISAMADRILRMRDGRIVSEDRNAVRVPASELTW